MVMMKTLVASQQGAQPCARQQQCHPLSMHAMLVWGLATPVHCPTRPTTADTDSLTAMEV